MKSGSKTLANWEANDSEMEKATSAIEALEAKLPKFKNYK